MLKCAFFLRIGRRPVFFLTVLINFSFGLLNMFVPTKELFAAARFLTCLAFFSIYQMPYIIGRLSHG